MSFDMKRDKKQVVASLRWLVFNFPFQNEPKDEADKLCNCIHVYCSDAIALLEDETTCPNYRKEHNSK